MSRIAIAASATGTGTVTLAAPVTNTDRTIVLPDSAGTILTTATAGVPISGPAFSAYAVASTSLTNGTFTKIGFDTEHFDTNSNFASSRFTPTVPGYYQINAVVFVGGSAGVTGAALYKNGAQYMYGAQAPNSAGGTLTPVSCLLYMNGTTDFVEVYVVQTTGGTVSNQIGLPSWNVFNGALVRSAI